VGKWAADYLAKNYVELWQGEKPTGKNIVGDDPLRLCLIYLASYADEKNNFECWVGIETQASEMRKDQRTVRRARAQLQRAGLMIDSGKRVRQAKVWQIVVPGFQDWFDENINTGAYAPDESVRPKTKRRGAKRGARTGAKRGAKTGAERGAKTGAETGALESASTPQTEQELKKENTHMCEEDRELCEARSNAMKKTKEMFKKHLETHTLSEKNRHQRSDSHSRACETNQDLSVTPVQPDVTEIKYMPQHPESGDLVSTKDSISDPLDSAEFQESLRSLVAELSQPPSELNAFSGALSEPIEFDVTPQDVRDLMTSW